jgi:hypothetical protein
MLRDAVGIDHVPFGSDYPYLRRELAVSCREHIEASPELRITRDITGGPRRENATAFRAAARA